MRIYLEKHHQFTEEYHLPSHKGQSTKFFWMCGQFLEKHSKVNKRSWIDDEVIIKKLKGHFGDVPLANIQPEQIEGYKASRKDFVKEATINRELAVLKTIYTKAVLWGYAYKNPVKEVRLFKEERIPIRILTAEERRKLLEASPDNLKPAILMALKTHAPRRDFQSPLEKSGPGARDDQRHAPRARSWEIDPPGARLSLRSCGPRLRFSDTAGRKMVFDGAIRKAFEQLRTTCRMPG